jgi:hypothetical protein
MNTFDFGIIGLGVGLIILEMRKSFSLTHEANPQHQATIDVKEFVGLIKQPRMLLIKLEA